MKGTIIADGDLFCFWCNHVNYVTLVFKCWRKHWLKCLIWLDLSDYHFHRNDQLLTIRLLSCQLILEHLFSAGHLYRHIAAHPSHQHVYSHKLKRLVSNQFGWWVWSSGHPPHMWYEFDCFPFSQVLHWCCFGPLAVFKHVMFHA